MSDSDATRHSLLIRLRDREDEQAWPDFVRLYAPFVYAALQRKGLQSADAADVAQDVMRTVFSSLDNFCHSGRSGAFRTWLLKIVHSRYCDFAKRNGREVAGSGDTQMVNQLNNQPAPESTDTELDLEYRRCIFRWAADRVQSDFKDTTWRAFWLTYVDGHSCEAAAESLGMSLGAVYMARGRVLARLRERISEVQD
jgi:RNA polymerase sigma-70 factor (ECF subfamily)